TGLDRHLAFDRHAERGEKSDSGHKVVDDDADVVQSLDRHVLRIAEAVRVVRPTVLASWTWLPGDFLPLFHSLKKPGGVVGFVSSRNGTASAAMRSAFAMILRLNRCRLF